MLERDHPTQKLRFQKPLSKKLPKQEGATIRITYPDENYEIICSYSEARYKKAKREMQKQIEKAKELIARKEAGKHAKFVKKEKATYLFDEALKEKTELLSL